MISALDIRHQLARLAGGKLSLNAFEEWIAPLAWSSDEDVSPDAVDLLHSIHLLFAERDNRRLKAPALLRELLLLLNDGNECVVISSDLEVSEEVRLPRHSWSASRWEDSALSVQV
jgi:hypothetical protein